MGIAQPHTDIEYPESDGRPMGETDLHRDWMVRVLELLRQHYLDQRVYISGDLLVYYEQGNPKKFVVPDVFVIKDCDPGRRRVFQTWKEGCAPEVVWEVTSRSTRREDETFKPRRFALIGVKEYFLYDPTSDYLRPPLKGHRLVDGEYREIEPEPSGALLSEQLGILHHLEGGELVMTDFDTGRRLMTGQEAEAAARRAEAAAREAEATARRAAEEEVRRLRALLEGRQRGDG